MYPNFETRIDLYEVYSMKAVVSAICLLSISLMTFAQSSKPAPTLLFEAAGAWSKGNISENGKRLAYTEYEHGSRVAGSTVKVVDLATKKILKSIKFVYPIDQTEWSQDADVLFMQGDASVKKCLALNLLCSDKRDSVVTIYKVSDDSMISIQFDGTTGSSSMTSSGNTITAVTGADHALLGNQKVVVLNFAGLKADLLKKYGANLKGQSLQFNISQLDSYRKFQDKSWEVAEYLVKKLHTHMQCPQGECTVLEMHNEVAVFNPDNESIPVMNLVPAGARLMNTFSFEDLAIGKKTFCVEYVYSNGQFRTQVVDLKANKYIFDISHAAQFTGFNISADGKVAYSETFEPNQFTISTYTFYNANQKIIAGPVRLNSGVYGEEISADNKFLLVPNHDRIQAIKISDTLQAGADKNTTANYIPQTWVDSKQTGFFAKAKRITSDSKYLVMNSETSLSIMNLSTKEMYSVNVSNVASINLLNNNQQALVSQQQDKEHGSISLVDFSNNGVPEIIWTSKNLGYLSNEEILDAKNKIFMISGEKGFQVYQIQ